MKISFREEYNTEFVSKSMGWLKKNNCLKDDFSDIPCPCCGKKKMRISDSDNKTSIYSKIKICLECSEDELIKHRLGLEKLSEEKWHINCHGEKSEKR